MRSIFLCILCYFLKISSIISQKTHLMPQFGIKVHDNTFSNVRTTGGRYVMFSPVVGLTLCIKEVPIKFNWQLDFNGLLSAVQKEDSSIIDRYFLQETWISHQIQIHYNIKKNIYLNVGAYWQRNEGVLNHLYPGSFEWKTWGAHLGVGLPISWLNIEYRTRIKLWPNFATVTSSSQHSLLFLYNFNRGKSTEPLDRFIILNGLIGGRFFYTGNIDLLYGEDLLPVGIAPLLGIEVIHRKSGISLNLERDWWIALNGGSPWRNIKGYINSSFIGFGYHKMLKNNHYLRFKLGASFIIDYDLLDELVLSNPDRDKIGTFYQVKGLGTMISYELLPHTDIEAKYTFPFNGYQFFNATRLSLGLVYRYTPNE